MKSILSIVVSNLRNDEYFQFMSEVDKLVVASTVAALGISDQYTPFKSGLTNVDEVLKVEKGSNQTRLIIEADEKRDRIHKGLELQVESNKNHWDESVVDAALRIGRIIGQYGNLRVLSYNEESSAIGNLVKELTSEANAPSLATIGLTTWVSKLGEANDAFQAIFNDRASEVASRSSGNVRAARLLLDPLYEAMVARVNALSVVNGEAAYADFIDKVNYYVDYYKNTISARKGRTTKEAKTKKSENNG